MPPEALFMPAKFRASSDDTLDAALRELERAVNELGLVAAYTGMRYPYPLDDARLGLVVVWCQA